MRTLPGGARQSLSMNFDSSHVKLFLPGERSEAQALGESVSVYRDGDRTRLLECPIMGVSSRRSWDRNRKAHISNLSCMESVCTGTLPGYRLVPVYSSLARPSYGTSL